MKYRQTRFLCFFRVVLHISILRFFVINFTGLDTDCEAVKRQVFELLSALCLYSTKGLHRALELLAQYKVSSHQVLYTTS